MLLKAVSELELSRTRRVRDKICQTLTAFLVNEERKWSFSKEQMRHDYLKLIINYHTKEGEGFVSGGTKERTDEKGAETRHELWVVIVLKLLLPYPLSQEKKKEETTPKNASWKNCEGMRLGFARMHEHIRWDREYIHRHTHSSPKIDPKLGILNLRFLADRGSNVIVAPINTVFRILVISLLSPGVVTRIVMKIKMLYCSNRVSLMIHLSPFALWCFHMLVE